MANDNVNKCVPQIQKMVKNYKIFIKKLNELKKTGNIDDITRRNLYINELIPNVINIFDEQVREFKHYLPNQILTNELKNHKFSKEEVEILQKTIQNTFDEKVINDLNQRIIKNVLNEKEINTMMKEELSNLNINNEILESILGQVSVDKKMEIFSYLKAYLKSGDYQKDKPKDIYEIFEKINERTLTIPQPFTFVENGQINYSIAPGGGIDIPYISTERKLYAIDTTYSTQVGIENDSFLRHKRDVYLINQRLKDAEKKGNIPFETLIEVLRNEYNSKDQELKGKDIFENLNKDEQIKLLNETTNYEVIHNVNSKEENQIMQIAYVMEIFKKQGDTNFTKEQIKSFVKELNINTINSDYEIELNKPLKPETIEKSLNYIRKNNLIKQNIFNISAFFENFTEENKSEKIKQILQKNLDIFAKGKIYVNVGEASMNLGDSIRKITKEYNLEGEFDKVYVMEKNKQRGNQQPKSPTPF